MDRTGEWTCGARRRSLGWLTGVATLALLAATSPSRAQNVAATGDIFPGVVNAPDWNPIEIAVGFDGTGAVDVTAGGAIHTTNSFLGVNPGSTGTATVTGAGSLWDTSLIIVGNGGTGLLTVEDGGQVSSYYGYLGNNLRSTGTATVTGAGSFWDNTTELYVGYSGTGVLNVEDGGQVSSDNSYLGRYSGSGTATVKGAGSSWDSTHDLFIGYRGTGVLNVEDGGQVSSLHGYLGFDAGSTGTATVTGAGSSWDSTSAVYVGYSGTGVLNVEDGGQVSSNYGSLGSYSGSAGTATVTGAGSSWDSTGLDVGGSGTGLLNVEDGGQVSSTVGYLGYYAGSTGTATVTGAGSAWDSTSALNVGNGGTGVLNVEDGGQVSSGNGYIGRLTNATGTATVTGTGSSWDNAGELQIGLVGIGVLNVEDGGQVSSGLGILGYSPSATGTATVTGGGSAWDSTANLLIGLGGTGGLNVEDGGQVSNSFGYVGYSFGATGTATVTGAGSSWTNASGLVVGSDGSGTLTIADGGVVNVDGGTGSVTVGNNSWSSGTINIGAAAGDAATAAGTLNARMLQFGFGTSTLVFNHTGMPGGTALSFEPEIAGMGAIEHLAGTTILTGDSSIFGGTTMVSGGNLLLGSGATLAGIVNVGASGALGGSGTLTGAVSVDGTLSAGNGVGTLTFTDNLTLNAGSNAEFELNSPRIIGGTGNDLVAVAGTLTQGGTLQAHAASAGYYRLFTYGALAGSFGAVNATGTGGFTVGSVQLSDNTLDHALDLAVLGAGQAMQFWDGADTAGNGTADGGSATWDAGVTNWTSLPGGHINDVWRSSVGVFGGTAGTVTVAGTQDFDTLQFASDGYELTGGALAIWASDGSTLNTDAGVTTTIGSVIRDGAGDSLRKAGAGTVVLTGTNTYSGGTALLGGTMSISDDANLGAASGGLTFAGGTLQSTGANVAMDRDIALLGNGTIDVTDSNILASEGNISGVGGLTKSGSGLLVLGGTNTYTGATHIAEGVLASLGGIADGSALTVDGGAQLALLGNETIGSLAGAGNVNFGANGPDLTTGGNNATTTYAGNFSATPGVSGSAVIKTGTGTMTLTGDSSGFAGSTTVSAGRLIVGSAGTGSLGGMIEVLSGATLGGTGALGATTIAAGGSHTPGNSIGTQTIDGNYVNHGTLAIEANATGADSVAVNGAVDIAGATLSLLLTPTSAANWDIANSPFTHTIIANDGADAVNGQFGTTTDLNQLLFLDTSLDYAGGDGNDVALLLTRNTTSFSWVAGTANQSGTARAIESLGSGPLYDAIVTQTDSNIVQASFDALSGEIGATAKGTLAAPTQKMADAVNDRLLGVSDDTGSAPVLAYGPGGPELAGSDTPLAVLWGSAFGTWGQFDGNDNAASLATRGGGLAGGIDGALGDWRLGLMAGYAGSAFEVADRSSTGSSDSYSLGLYGGTEWGALAFRSSLTATAHDLATSRDVVIPGFTDHLSADYRARSLQAFAELGYRLDLSNATSVEPFANLTQLLVDTDGYSETGGAAALTSAPGTASSTFTTIGLRASHQVAMGTVLATLRAMAGWRHGFGDLAPASTMAFAGSTPFTVTGAQTPADTALLSTGLEINLTEALTIGLTYAGRFANGTSDSAASATVAGTF